MRDVVRSVAARVRRDVGPGELTIVVGLGFLVAGLWPLSPAVALVAAGAVLLWVALPSRKPFIVRETPPVLARRGRTRKAIDRAVPVPGADPGDNQRRLVEESLDLSQRNTRH